MLSGKTVVLGVSGSIAAYKIAYLASSLVKMHADVHVVMTANATNFINPITFETLTSNKCLTDTFDRDFEFHVGHVALGQKADVVMVAPASADIIAKIAHGIADDMLTTTLLATSAPIIVAPAMNTHMFHNAFVQENIEILKKHNIQVISPAYGYLACGDTGDGKMPEPEVLKEYIIDALTTKDMSGKHVLVTAGPTQESLDPVRYISNHSTGKMGIALATAARRRGAEVTLVCGPTTETMPDDMEVIRITSAKEMYDAVVSRADAMDIIIKAAAVGDYRPKSVSDEKIKKQDDDMSIMLERTDDILSYIGSHKKKGQFICGFAMETQNLLESAKKKLDSKHADMIVANSLRTEGAGFGTDTNVITMVTDKDVTELPLMSKMDTANQILNKIMQIIK